MDSSSSRYGLIAGNGRFPLLALQTAKSLGHEVVVIAIQDEAAAEIEQCGAPVHWITIAQLGKLIDILKQEGIREVMMTGQVKHVSIFSALQPDWRLFKLLASLKEKNTSALIGGVQRVLRDEGIELVDSTALLKPLLAGEGVLTKRKPTKEEESDIRYGRRVAHVLASVDVGQSVAISEKACVAAEAMEGTDAMLRRACALANGKPLRLVKVSRGRAHMLFDVPVAGPGTIETMLETGTTALALDSGRTLLIDKAEMIEVANRAGITIVGFPPEDESK
ncbi:MAG: UDP-2,3-diacylglucosamine diphosphatase LpxI [Bryobacteraceae bacterium]